jgi:hypothetical protein
MSTHFPVVFSMLSLFCNTFDCSRCCVSIAAAAVVRRSECGGPVPAPSECYGDAAAVPRCVHGGAAQAQGAGGPPPGESSQLELQPQHGCIVDHKILESGAANGNKMVLRSLMRGRRAERTSTAAAVVISMVRHAALLRKYCA